VSGAPPADGAFTGLRILELVEGIGGPYATMFLADNGADVVKVESRQRPDHYRSDPGFLTINRNKRSALADHDRLLDDPSVRDLAARADVVVVGSGEDAETVRSVNKNAMVLVVTDWGSEAQKREPFASLPQPSAQLVHAATGIAWNQQSYAEVPVDVVVPLAHYATGVLGAMAITAGLLAAGSGGVTYEVSLVAGAAAIQLGESRPAGPVLPRPGESTMGSKGRVACYRLVEAGDGKWFFLACGTKRFYERMLSVIGRPDLLDDPILANPPWGLMFDEPIERLTPILDAAFATRSRSEWLQALAEADVPAQPVLTRDEFLSTSIVEANKMSVSLDHPDQGPVSMMGLPFTIMGAPGALRHPGPPLGAHHDEVHADWLSSPSPLVSSSQSPSPAPGVAPLAGLKVVDLASFIAGPVVGRHLGMLGADVIKVEPPGGDPFRAIGPMFVSWNQGKRSIELDLTSQEGRDVLHRLVADADVLIENFRPGVADRLGADEQTLRSLNPRLIVLSSPGYGTDEAMADKPAFDPLVQALGGLMASQGGIDTDTGVEPVFLSVPVHDLFTPIVSTVGVLAALRLRHQTGEGQRVDTSLAHSTMVAQAAEYTRFEGRQAPRSGGFDFPGFDDEHSWSESSEGALVWHHGDRNVEVCTVGLTGAQLGELGGLVFEADHQEHGPMVMIGQLITGAGPHPPPAPLLNEHEEQILRSGS